MFRVLIVDDEPAIRHRLRNAIEWKKNGFEIAGEASDGEEALALVQDLKPEVVITDIRMPVINGLELAKRIKKLSPELHIVILSGYSDFEYAQEAIKYGVEEYLLKPVEENELEIVLGKIKNNIEDKMKMTNYLSEANYALREKLITDILYKRVKGDVFEQGKELGLDFNKTYIGLLLVEIDDFDLLIINRNDDEVQEIKILVKSAIEEMIRNHNNWIVLEEGENRYIVFSILYYTADHSEEMMAAAERIRTYIKKILNSTVTIGLGSPVADPALVFGCFKEAKACLEGKFLLGKNRILTINDIILSNDDNSWNKVFGWDRNNLYEAIENNDQENVHEIIVQLFNLIKNEKLSITVTNSVIVENLVTISRMVKKIEGDLNQIFGENFNIELFLKKTLTLEELMDWFMCICIKAADYILKVRKNRPKKISERVMEIIDNQFGEDLSLRSLSKIIYMSPVYLGQVFKNETGKSFNDYLTEIRIKNSKKMLIETDLHIYEISEKVGYQAPSNFFAAFKKIEACSPLDYRKRIMGISESVN